MKFTSTIGLAFMLASQMSVSASPPVTSEDAKAQSELDRAGPKLRRILELTDGELARQTQSPAPPPDPEVALLLNPAPPVLKNLGDPRTPLHQRIVEAARLSFVERSNLAHWLSANEARCNMQGIDMSAAAMTDSKGRSEALDRIQCARSVIKEFDSRWRMIHQSRESRIHQMNLPAFTEARVLSGQQSNSRQEAAAFEDMFKRWRKQYDALENVVQFFESRQGAVHAESGNLRFDNEADIQTMRDLQERLKNAAQ